MTLELPLYSYDYTIISNITQTDQIIGIILIVLGIIIYLLLPSLYQYREKQALIHDKIIKRQAIGDLISMKEIQGEIEKEMRDALIRSELRTKPEAKSVDIPAWGEAQVVSAQK